MASQGYYNQGPQYPQQRYAVHFVRGPRRYLDTAANRVYEDKLNYIEERFGLIDFRIQLRRWLSSARIPSPAIWWL